MQRMSQVDWSRFGLGDGMIEAGVIGLGRSDVQANVFWDFHFLYGAEIDEILINYRTISR
jgi:hypothetical protein